ncbi:MAG: glycosyltransferase family 4 protein [Chloroflexales bacterium]|nr:glycosyltransferase family 4 protein [Chloroflexales bacterium]
MRSVLIAKPGHPNTGVGRYVRMLDHGLREDGVEVMQVTPVAPPLPDAAYASLRRLRIDLRSFLLHYPLWANYPPADVYHVTSQNLATLLLLRRPTGRVIVTVHDIIPYMLRNDPQLCVYRTFADRLFDRLALLGLRRADHLIADSQYTRQCVVEQLGMEPGKIDVVHLGIDHQRFRPVAASPALYARYRLPVDRRYLIYVGSEDPRKNLGALLHALATVRQTCPDVALIKVGRAYFERERQRLLDLASSLGIGDAIYFLDDVPEDDLPALYSLATVCVLPSLYEGFGFPVLEAMACGTPVVCAWVASLPELVDKAALIFRPDGNNGAEIAAAIRCLLTDELRRQELAGAGLAQAANFRWDRTAARTCAVYHTNQHPGTSRPTIADSHAD